ncbi:MAG: NAD(P)-dependent oxidoreductase [Pseudomonas capeferrum]|jgi:nucleoside-diphosphate-sugar epimerase|uniref:NAD-dependent epimerase/dehydratase family protein n=1 Tax=Pseudomonas sp. 39004 TaxID=2967213 RepID=UPI002363C78F|nr:NAD(P)-dependent oxidoreductase [Pseudomonas sp. 39004]MDD1959924.1 NAD(P)-dependent oxidoreductase [Pseudomonas sp. 39004]
MNKLVVIGGSGFVGRHFLDSCSALRDTEVVYAIHRTEPDWLCAANVRIERFDVDDPESLAVILAPGCTVINLLRPDGSGWFEPAIVNVLKACEQVRVKRYVHVSSIDVFGAAPDPVVDAATPIQPRTPYEREHAAAEALVRAVAASRFEVLVLRLGAVFGDGGLNIVSFVREVSSAPAWKLGLRRVLYGPRRMHLVSVEKVGQTLVFVAQVPEIRQGEVVLVTDDAAAENNFGYLQDALLKAFGRPSISYLPHVPQALLGLLLRLRKVSNANPMRRFSEARLAEWRQPPTADFKQQLHRYIAVLKESA